MLIGFRALQGAAAALMLPQVLTFIQAEFDPEPRRAAFAVYGMLLALVSSPPWRAYSLTRPAR
jgi:MFS family permease